MSIVVVTRGFFGRAEDFDDEVDRLFDGPIVFVVVADVVVVILFGDSGCDISSFIIDVLVERIFNEGFDEATDADGLRLVTVNTDPTVPLIVAGLALLTMKRAGGFAKLDDM